jgi:hypothetical protein
VPLAEAALPLPVLPHD